MNEYLVLTADIGGKDTLLDPPIKFEGCDYIAMVDMDYKTSIWEQFGFYKFSSVDLYSNRRNAKLYKVLSTILFPNYKYIIWQDASHTLKIHPKDIIDEYGDFDLLLFNHPHRNCVYKEMDVIKERRLDNPKIVEEQYQYYLEQGMPRDLGLYEMTCFIKKNDPKITQLELMWWEHICKFSSRDQCSFNYCLWRCGSDIQIKTFNGYANRYAGGNKYFNEHGHNR